MKNSEAVIGAYDVAKRVRDGALTRAAGIEDLHQRFGTNRSSASATFANIAHMLNGEPYKRTMNALETEHILQMIDRDYATDGLRKAITSVEKHIRYYEGLSRGSKLLNIWRLVRKYRDIARDPKGTGGDNLGRDAISDSVLPEEINQPTGLVEGAVRSITVNAYERSPQVRQQCIEAHGTACCICGFSFLAVYGEVAKGYIHVHHLRPLSEVSGEYLVDPVMDLRPVCPNCHAVLHLGGQCRSLDEVKQMVERNPA